MQFADVVVLGTRIGEMSDKFGRATLRGLTVGQRVIWVHALCYPPLFDTVTVSPGKCDSLRLRIARIKDCVIEADELMRVRPKHTPQAVLKVVAYATYKAQPGLKEAIRFGDVRVDGQSNLTGEVGTVVFHLMPGRHVVRFRVLGFEEAVDTVDLRSGEDRTLKHHFVGTNPPESGPL